MMKKSEADETKPAPGGASTARPEIRRERKMHLIIRTTEIIIDSKGDRMLPGAAMAGRRKERQERIRPDGRCQLRFAFGLCENKQQ